MKSLFAVLGDIILFFIFTCILIIPCLVLLNLIPSVNSQTNSGESVVAENISAISVESTSLSSLSSSKSESSISSESQSLSTTSISSSSSSGSKSTSTKSTTLATTSQVSSVNSTKSTSSASAQVKGASTATTAKSTAAATSSVAPITVFSEDVRLSDKIILENKTLTATEAKFNLKITDIGSGVDQTVQLGKFVNNSTVTKEVSIIFGDYVGIFDKSIVNIKTDTYTYLIQKPAAGLTITLNPKETTYINLILKTNAAMRNEKLLIDMVF